MTKNYKRGCTQVAVLVLFLSLMGCHASGSIGTTFKGAVQLSNLIEKAQ